ncbi:MAG TPA: alpha/beta fold hydrolase [Candidatus Binataceae bacterium]|nr:alpha/beta fold hydrolase [Candidatus Binataceae bacterium]
MDERRVTFPAGDLTLEGLLGVANSPSTRPGAVVCHPHPMYGGSMHNNVVEAILDSLWQRGFATLRFNFRGVGDSEGEYDGGEGEGDDAAAAITFLKSQAGVSAEGLVLAGYSFGAMVALRRGLEAAEVARVIAVALPIGMARLEPTTTSKPVLMVSGDSDSYSPVDGLKKLRERLGSESKVQIIAGADHFFGGYEAQLSRMIAAALG